MADLYRKSALEKISNPEQLDKALIVTSPLSWLALLAVTLIVIVTIVWSIIGRLPETLTLSGYVVSGGGSVSAIYPDETGTITVHARRGDALYADVSVATIRLSNGNTVEVYPDINGIVTEVIRQDGETARSGQPILYFAPTQGDLVTRDQLVLCYVPAKGGSDMSGQLTKGSKVKVAHMTPSGENNQSTGYMTGTVLYVERYPASSDNVVRALGSEQIYSDNAGNGAIKTVVILPDIREDPTTGGNPYVWSNPKGEKLIIRPNDTFTVSIIVDEVRPIEKLFAKIGEIMGW